MKLAQYEREDILGKRVLVRCDLDVKLNEEGYVDAYHDLRLERIVPTLHDLFSHGARQIILTGHRGRPGGKHDPAFSLAPVADRLGDLCFADGLDEHIAFIDDLTVEPYSYGDNPILMLENVRFWEGEKEKNESFARSLARWGEVYVNDAFGSSHRDTTSMTLVPGIMGSSFAGPELIKEVAHLQAFRENIRYPFVALLGGAKISTKLPLIEYLIEQADHLVLGGGLANTLLAAQGVNVGTSLVEEDMISRAKQLPLDKIFMVKDVVTDKGDVVQPEVVGADRGICDLGPASIEGIQALLADAKSILWNGPLGKFEDPQFSKATYAVAHAIAKNQPADVVVGGGETLEVLERLNSVDKFDFVSTGGGAMLTFLAGGPMPGLLPVQA